VLFHNLLQPLRRWLPLRLRALELGISTQTMPAGGPVGLEGLDHYRLPAGVATGQIAADLHGESLAPMLASCVSSPSPPSRF